MPVSYITAPPPPPCHPSIPTHRHRKFGTPITRSGVECPLRDAVILAVVHRSTIGGATYNNRGELARWTINDLDERLWTDVRLSLKLSVFVLMRLLVDATWNNCRGPALRITAMPRATASKLSLTFLTPQESETFILFWVNAGPNWPSIAQSWRSSYYTQQTMTS